VSFLLVASLFCSRSGVVVSEMLGLLDFPQHARMMALIDTRNDHRIIPLQQWLLLWPSD
jgi:hypothetical protein